MGWISILCDVAQGIILLGYIIWYGLVGHIMKYCVWQYFAFELDGGRWRHATIIVSRLYLNKWKC